MSQVFSPRNTNAIAVTATSQSRPLPSGTMDTVVFYNDGPATAFVAQGDSAVVAVAPALATNIGAETNSTPIPVGQSVAFSRVTGASNWAAICATGLTAGVYCTVGTGE
jgi:hypothetical protein